MDDASENLEILHKILVEEYDVRLAKSGNMALMILDSIKPDLILLDIEMPEMSGFDLLESIKIRPSLAEVPVIFVTAHASVNLVFKAEKQGITDYIVKPFERNTLLERVRKALV
ncbi:hypothetical protein FACS1894127_4200 [Clostridia bacterium]|nr:hypothetical protein FACS1894127_4200 [Clostridia bacterium]